MRTNLTKKELMKKLKILNLKDKEQRNKVVCSLIGHSRISTTCWGYRYCARCGTQVGDNLGSCDYGVKDAVIIGHNCKICRKNYKKCTWKDRLYCSNPFPKKKK